MRLSSLRFVPISLALAFATSPVHAQDDFDEEAAEEEAGPTEPSPQDVERAQAQYASALEKFEAGDYEAAYKGFERSYETVPSPNSHFMMARALARLGENERAYRMLTAVIQEADQGGERYAATATSARAKREEVRPRVGLLHLDTSGLPKGSAVDVEGRELTEAELSEPVAVLPGKVTLLVHLPDGKEFEESVYVKTGDEERVSLSKPVAEDGTEKRKKKKETGSYVTRDEDHVDYLVEATIEGAYTSIEPPGLPNHGGGPGGRLGIQILNTGFVPGFNDSFGIGGGVDWAASSLPDHFWIPVYVQWNVWLTPKWSVMAEPGVAFMTDGGSTVNLNLAAGARYMLVDDFFAVTARVGIPLVSLGVSAFF